uniref:Rab3 GTPase-activating protein non-catalytic subunit n=1 Tax=Globodera rostochiensis TaxID=31243 RepID=A0A914HIL0_GLORO
MIPMIHNKLTGRARISTDTIILIEKFLNKERTSQRVSPKSDFEGKKFNETLLYPPERPDEFDFETDDDEEIEAEASINTEKINLSSLVADVDGLDNDLVRRWLRKSLISLSVNMEVLVISTAQKFVVLERSKRSADDLNLMEVVAKVEVAQDDRTFILSLAVFGVQPSASNSSSQSLTTDWTCICIGLSTGDLMFYTERGTLIFSEKCANCPILSLRLGHSVLPGNQELVALTSAAKLIVIEGLSLYTTLRSARAQIARADRSINEICESLQLNAHQLQLDRYEHVGDFQTVGLTRPGTFDQYMSAFYSAGRNETVSRTQLPIYAHYMCTPATKKRKDGDDNSEFVSFLWHDTQPVVGTLSDAIFSLTSHITNNIPSFGFRSFTGLGISRKDRIAKKSALDARTKWVPIKSILRDSKRVAERSFIAPSPGWPFVAISDNLGRVLLINTRTRRIIRIWKGYRQARCAWIEAASTSRTSPQKRALFLVIFAPKRGLLEVWSMLNGPRVSAFQVEEGGRLLSIPTIQNGILLGGADIRESESQKTSRAGSVFLTPNGFLYSIDVPFHHSALSASATSVYDEYLIKEFTLDHFTVQPENTEEAGIDLEKLVEFVHRIKTNLAKQRFLEALIVSSEGAFKRESVKRPKGGTLISVRTLRDLVSQMVGNAQNPTDKNISPSESERHSPISPYLLALHSAIDFYATLDDKLAESLYNKNSHNVEFGEWTKHLSLPRCDRNAPLMTKALSIIELVYQNSESLANTSTVVDRIVRCRLDLHDFLNFFNLNLYQNFDSGVQMESTLSPADDKNMPSVSTTLLAKLGATIFAPFLLNCSLDLESFLRSLTSKFRLSKNFLITILCAFWLDPQYIDNGHWAGPFNETLKTIEQMVIATTNVPAALMVAIQMGDVCQQLSISLDERKTDRENVQKLPRDDDDDLFIVFDKYELELQSGLRDELPHFWALASLHLSVFHLLQWLFQQTVDVSNTSLLSPSNFCIAKLIQKGVGFYREQLGLWVSQMDRPPSFSARDIVSVLVSDGQDENKDYQNCFDAKISFTLRLLCKETLPQSLRMELILCDCVWECASAWFKDESRRITKLKRSIDLLDFLHTAPKLQNGLAQLLWETFVASSFEKCFLLIEEQMGSAGPGRSDGGTSPLKGKDRLLRRDVLVVEKDLPEYVSCIRKLLEILAESCCHLCSRQDIAYGPLAGTLHLEDSEITNFVGHHRLKQHLSLTDRKLAGIIGEKTLTQLVDYQKPVNYHLALHMVHLAAVIEIQINLTTSAYSKPSSLFDTNGKRALFNPFHTHPLLPMGRVDDRTKMRRQRFVEQCMEALEKESETQQDNERCRELRRVVDRLTREWTLDVTTLQVNEITRLYLSGADEEAEAKCDGLFGNRQKLALELVPIIAGRINQASTASPSTMAFIKDAPDEYMPNFDQIESKRAGEMQITLWNSRNVSSFCANSMKYAALSTDLLKDRVAAHQQRACDDGAGNYWLTILKDNMEDASRSSSTKNGDGTPPFVLDEAEVGIAITIPSESVDMSLTVEHPSETNDSQQPETDSLLSISQSESDTASKTKSKTPSRAFLAPEVTHIPIQSSDVVEYEWPQKTGVRFFLQEQISELLGINSFKRKYPEMARRTVEPVERDYLLGELKVNIALPSHHLTALQSADVHELMSSEYPNKYVEYQKVCNERLKRLLLEKQKEMEMIKLDAKKMAELRQKAVKSASEFNSELQFVRKTERQQFWEMNTNVIHSPLNKWMRLSAEHSKPSKYPVFLMPGQYTTHYRKFDPAQLRSFPFGSVVKSDELFLPKRGPSPPAISVSEKELEAAKNSNERKEVLDSEKNASPKSPQKEREIGPPPAKLPRMSVSDGGKLSCFNFLGKFFTQNANPQNKRTGA